MCRGNFRSTWISEGGYEPVAEVLLAGIDYDGYFLEYDTDRAGGLEPLRFLPKGKKRVVVGLVTSKSGELEKKDDIKRRLDEAARYAPMEQLCLSPQCGFASTEEGNVLTEDAAVGQAQDDRRYLERGVEGVAAEPLRDRAEGADAEFAPKEMPMPGWVRMLGSVLMYCAFGLGLLVLFEIAAHVFLPRHVANLRMGIFSDKRALFISPGAFREQKWLLQFSPECHGSRGCLFSRPSRQYDLGVRLHVSIGRDGLFFQRGCLSTRPKSCCSGTPFPQGSVEAAIGSDSALIYLCGHASIRRRFLGTGCGTGKVFAPSWSCATGRARC